MANWPHAPVHRLSSRGAYMVTGGIYLKRHLLHDTERLSLIRDTLLSLAEGYGWNFQAWAVMSNHYHFVAISPSEPESLKAMLSQFHNVTSTRLNRLDRTPDRKVWYQYWDSLVTFPKSYFARLHYVHQNPVRHGVATAAVLYPWCSAAWFEREASRAFQKTVASFKIDQLNIRDDF